VKPGVRAVRDRVTPFFFFLVKTYDKAAGKEFFVPPEVRSAAEEGRVAAVAGM